MENFTKSSSNEYWWTKQEFTLKVLKFYCLIIHQVADTAVYKINDVGSITSRFSENEPALFALSRLQEKHDRTRESSKNRAYVLLNYRSNNTFWLAITLMNNEWMNFAIYTQHTSNKVRESNNFVGVSLKLKKNTCKICCGNLMLGFINLRLQHNSYFFKVLKTLWVSYLKDV